jgi:hypothetical protein
LKEKLKIGEGKIENWKLSSEGGSPPEEGRPACRQAGSSGGKIYS